MFSVADLRAAETAAPPSVAAGTPTGDQAPPAPPAEKPQARKEDIEPETLPAALTALKEARTARDNAEAELAKITAELATARGYTKAALDEAERLKGELKTATDSIAALTGERDKARTELADAVKKISLLEGLCSVKGVSPSAAVGQEPAPEAQSTVADFEKRIAAAKDPAEKQKIAAEFEAAVKAGKVA